MYKCSDYCLNLEDASSSALAVVWNTLDKMKSFFINSPERGLHMEVAEKERY